MGGKLPESMMSLAADIERTRLLDEWGECTVYVWGRPETTFGFVERADPVAVNPVEHDLKATSQSPIEK